MKKIPTIFERDWDGDRSRVLDAVNPDAAWVFEGEGWPTRKLDGTSCMIRDGKLYKRREYAQTDRLPADFETVDIDPVTGKGVGWVPVGDGPEDRWHREAFERENGWANGTYELIGPKVQGNPESASTHMLIAHHDDALRIGDDFKRDFETIRAFLDATEMEGIVYHHPDGRMAKIKGRDFGIKRKKAAA